MRHIIITRLSESKIGKKSELKNTKNRSKAQAGKSRFEGSPEADQKGKKRTENPFKSYRFVTSFFGKVALS